jgi:hypothetical protein
LQRLLKTNNFKDRFRVGTSERGGGYKERRWEGKYGGNILYTYM